jgi:hypothetical protein
VAQVIWHLLSKCKPRVQTPLLPTPTPWGKEKRVADSGARKTHGFWNCLELGLHPGFSSWKLSRNTGFSLSHCKVGVLVCLRGGRLVIHGRGRWGKGVAVISKCMNVHCTQPAHTHLEDRCWKHFKELRDKFSGQSRRENGMGGVRNSAV